MNDTEEPYRAKARECLAGAASELANGRFNNASNRAYYAAYNAAIIALLRAGLASRNNRWDHDEVAARFAGEPINRRKLYPSDMGATLVGLSLTRQAADYGKKQVTRSVAQQSVRDASRFCSVILK